MDTISHPDIPIPRGAIWAEQWGRDKKHGPGRWLSVGDWEVTLVGYPDDLAEPRRVTVFGLAFQRPSGEVVNPYVHVESDPDHPLSLADTDELIAVLGEVRERLRSLSDSNSPG